MVVWGRRESTLVGLGGKSTLMGLGGGVFAGMLGVTFFGLVLTPVFYVLVRGVGLRRAVAAEPKKAATAAPILAEM